MTGEPVPSPGRKRSDWEQVSADKMPARVAGALTGLALGGPVGAVIGAALAPPLELMLKRGNERLGESVGTLWNGVPDDLGMTTEELVTFIDQKDERIEFSMMATSAAASTLNDDKLRALKTALTTGLRDDALIDLAGLAVSVLGVLQAPHLRVMRTLVLHHLAYDGRSYFGMQVVELIEALPQLREGMIPVLSLLNREGLIRFDLKDSLCAATTFGGFVFWLVADSENSPRTRLNFVSTIDASEDDLQTLIATTCEMEQVGNENGWGTANADAIYIGVERNESASSFSAVVESSLPDLQTRWASMWPGESTVPELHLPADRFTPSKHAQVQVLTGDPARFKRVFAESGLFAPEPYSELVDVRLVGTTDTLWS